MCVYADTKALQVAILRGVSLPIYQSAYVLKCLAFLFLFMLNVSMDMDMVCGFMDE